MKSLRFNPETSLLPIPTLASMSDEQLADLYYCDEASSSRIYQDVITNIRQMQMQIDDQDQDQDQDSSSSSLSYCPRGLEHMLSSEHSRSLQAERDALYDALLDEQDRQWEANSGDSVRGSSVVDYEDHTVSSERLAEVSRRHSSGAVQRALRLAQADADFVASYNPPPSPPSPPPPQEEEEEEEEEAAAQQDVFHGRGTVAHNGNEQDIEDDDAQTATMADVLTKVLSMSDLMTLDEPAPALQHVPAAPQPSLTSSTRSSASWPPFSNATAAITATASNRPATTTTASYQRGAGAIGLPRRSGSDISSSSHQHRGTAGRHHVSLVGGPTLRRKCTSLLDLKTLSCSSQHATMNTTPFERGGGGGRGSLPSSLQVSPAILSPPVQGDDDYLFFQLDS